MTIRRFLTSGAVAAAVLVAVATSANATLYGSFSGAISNFNFGPLVGGTAFSATFEIDDSVPGVGPGTFTFANAVDNLVLTIGSDVFSGGDGRLQQFTDVGGAVTDFFAMLFNSAVGATLGGTTPSGWGVTSVGFDLRAPIGTLFADPALLVGGFDIADLTYHAVTMRFDDLATTGTVESALAVLFVNEFSLSAVPEPATLGLFALALAVLAATLRPRRLRPAPFGGRGRHRA